MLVALPSSRRAAVAKGRITGFRPADAAGLPLSPWLMRVKGRKAVERIRGFSS